MLLPVINNNTVNVWKGLMWIKNITCELEEYTKRLKYIHVAINLTFKHVHCTIHAQYSSICFAYSS